MIWVLRFFPPFCLGKGLYYAINIEVFALLEEDINLSAWSESILLMEVLFLILQSVAYTLLAIQMDKWSTNPRFLSTMKMILCCTWICGSRSEPETALTPDDDDVIQEENRVKSGEANGDLIVLSNLTKRYDNGKLAVNDMSLGIPHGECFGLLGINGECCLSHVMWFF